MEPFEDVVENGGHCLHDDWPTSDAYVPIAQGKHSPPLEEKVPRGHGEHDAAPASEVSPGEQAEQN